MPVEPYLNIHHFNINDEGIRKLLQSLDPLKDVAPETLPTPSWKRCPTKLQETAYQVEILRHQCTSIVLDLDFS